jgi:hypothetical protein
MMDRAGLNRIVTVAAAPLSAGRGIFIRGGIRSGDNEFNGARMPGKGVEYGKGKKNSRYEKGEAPKKTQGQTPRTEGQSWAVL